MRRITKGVSAALLLALTGGTMSPAAQGSGGLPIDVEGLSPGQQVTFALNAGNNGKTASAIANAQGQASTTLDFGNAPKPHVRVDIYTFTWPTPPDPPQVVVKMVDHGAPPPDDPCGNRRFISSYWLDQTGQITIYPKGRKGRKGRKTLKYVLIGAGTAGGIVIAANAGGGSSPSGTSPTPTPTPTPTPPPPGFNPSGVYVGNLRVSQDQAHHDQFTHFSTVTTVTVNVNGTTITITGPSPWVPVTGPFNSSTGAFSGNGSGVVAGFSNVPIQATGTLVSPGLLNFTMVQLGPTNLPQNQAEVLTGSFNKTGS